VAEADVKANYMNGILEIRIPAPVVEPPAPEPAATKIPIATS
jgi:HSP20 family molecular chaperone IbpA